MINEIFRKYTQNSALEVQFRLGYKTIIKVNQDWVEAEAASMTINEWEDLKDYCLKSEEKMQLETKGSVRGQIVFGEKSWNFSFVEWKDSLKAYFSVLSSYKNSMHIQNPTYWDSLKSQSGLHLVSGFRQSGKSSFIRELLENFDSNNPLQAALHAYPSILTQYESERAFILGSETLLWDTMHPIYEGIDLIICDFNEVMSWSKWIQFAEQGKKVIISISADEIKTVLLQVRSQLSEDSALWSRFAQQLRSVIFQQKLNSKEGSIQEILVFKNKNAEWSRNPDLVNNKFLEESTAWHYQSLNQSIVQALLKRRIDIKTAFKISNEPDQLDLLLKKMGL